MPRVSSTDSPGRKSDCANSSLERLLVIGQQLVKRNLAVASVAVHCLVATGWLRFKRLIEVTFYFGVVQYDGRILDLAPFDAFQGSRFFVAVLSPSHFIYFLAGIVVLWVTRCLFVTVE